MNMELCNRYLKMNTHAHPFFKLLKNYILKAQIPEFEIYLLDLNAGYNLDIIFECASPIYTSYWVLTFQFFGVLVYKNTLIVNI